MLRFCKALILAFALNAVLAQGIAVNQDGSDPDNSAILDISSADMGFLAPRMTTSQRTSISVPATGLIVYDTDEACYFQYDGVNWINFEITDRGTVSETFLLRHQ